MQQQSSSNIDINKPCIEFLPETSVQETNNNTEETHAIQKVQQNIKFAQVVYNNWH